jgi:hypothetical protein
VSDTEYRMDERAGIATLPCVLPPLPPELCGFPDAIGSHASAIASHSALDWTRVYSNLGLGKGACYRICYALPAALCWTCRAVAAG